MSKADEIEKAIERTKRILIADNHNIKTQVYISDLNKILQALKEKDKMIDYIMTHYQIKTMKKTFCENCTKCKGIKRDCIKEYFRKKVENE